MVIDSSLFEIVLCFILGFSTLLVLVVQMGLFECICTHFSKPAELSYNNDVTQII